MKRFYPFLSLAALVAFAISSSGQNSAPKGVANNSSGSGPATGANSRTAAPVTERYDTGDQTAVGEPILPAPPMPKGSTTLIGGTVEGVDHVRNRVAIKPFGGKRMMVHFDERTHIYRDGVETTQLAIRKGERVYVDTMAAGSEVLARNIRVVTQLNAADTRGQVINASNGELSIRDELSGEPVKLAVDDNTRVTRDGRQVPLTEVTPGSLVAIEFSPNKADRGVARQIDLLAAPGSMFTFAGRVTNLDLSQGLMSIANQSDDRTYDVSVLRPQLPGDLMVGSDVVVKAVFDGKEYKANSVDVTQARTQNR
ncbi:MAG TPA: hypothetical protein VKW78_19560 [Terriglobales bacterium]|nr:hypothetical protein [Terriglobales bacterium]